MKKIHFEQSLGHLFHIIILEMRSQLEKELKAFGVTNHQFGTLLLISKLGSLTQRQISEATVGDEGLTSRLIGRLINKKVVKKQKNPDDRRQQLVSLTIKGEELLQQIIPLAIKGNQKVEELIDDNEYRTLLKILNKIKAGIR
ncbi:MarR family winged helix-turn-helix transcriptional regulator [Sulfurimonas sp.]|uniref:MarR family winged helix-turn-helix transcriptional regulator n=1 Tax=Sulfurimonas sp. TaxID=2022749 RepID=UPI002B469D79|nr:MarR family transcriptional regulator [Sulfurimonas sp.]